MSRDSPLKQHPGSDSEVNLRWWSWQLTEAQEERPESRPTKRGCSSLNLEQCSLFWRSLWKKEWWQALLSRYSLRTHTHRLYLPHSLAAGLSWQWALMGQVCDCETNGSKDALHCRNQRLMSGEKSKNLLEVYQTQSPRWHHSVVVLLLWLM